ncbi:MarR family transcriptional regulator [Enterococcus hermanniensis]|uniref:HTH marR-type domain-containing protein n=1 Tax=Enterococcus hermanniensis TaxID=249189 RepID=A0A1L8TRG8_9ENTE|nr:MarR family transcriptional regulator [Enterococcus hermanniensis]OJG46915.1 hypothetical protein RV04_GL000162 [Enterococcus hermanniensis]
MSHFTEELMQQLRFIRTASNAFISKRQRLTGQQRVLAILDKEDGLIQSQLAEILDIRPSSLAELMKKMEKSDDVRRQEEEQDRRIKRVYLTEKGKEKAKKLGSTGGDMSEAFFAGLTEEEQQQFSETLQKISDGWKDEFKKQAGRFVDPMDRLRQMQAMREQMADNWKNLSREEQRQLRNQMKRQMRDTSHEFPRNKFPRDFQQNFWGNPDYFNQPEEPKKSADNEWEDF